MKKIIMLAALVSLTGCGGMIQKTMIDEETGCGTAFGDAYHRLNGVTPICDDPVERLKAQKEADKKKKDRAAAEKELAARAKATK